MWKPLIWNILLGTITKYDKLLICTFLLTLPLCNPWVRGDGVGYYAYARSLLIEHRLNFEQDWEHGNDTFRSGRLDSDGHILADQFTKTGRIGNIWTIGPSILWLPFLLVTNAGVLVCNHFGAHIPADGFSTPYLLAMAGSTAIYGFLAVWISFRLAREYFREHWAFLATLGIWWASSLPVYMYFNPSWSHAHSAFVVALFVWYWHRTRGERTVGQWVLLGLVSGLMVDVYYPNGLLLLIPLMEAITCYWKVWNKAEDRAELIPRLLARHTVYVAVWVFALLPTLISRYIIFGSALQTGYMPAATWNWKSPRLWEVLFSSDHGLLYWTPILILALGGLLLFSHADRFLASSLIAVAISFYLVIAFYPDWDGISSFGNRFFVSLTALFVLGLAAAFTSLGRLWRAHGAVVASTVTTLLILWNLGLVFQWGTHLIPARGPVSWTHMAHNQFFVVPQRAAAELKSYFGNRSGLMRQIEQQDVSQVSAQEQTRKQK